MPQIRPQSKQSSLLLLRFGRQRGQALIYGLFVLTAGLASLFFLFNTGQLSSEKTKLVNTADAVAYSAGIMHARALNYEAYANRAMLANTVAIAQLVSLSSWVQYANNMSSYGYVLNNWQFEDDLISYEAAQYLGPELNQSLISSGALEDLATGSDTIIQDLLMTAQEVAYSDLIPARKKVMDEVANLNYLNDGVVTVDPIPLTVNEFTSFISSYSDDKRTRFAEIANKSVQLDSFNTSRSWYLLGLGSDCPYAEGIGNWDFLTKRGGTELIGFDEWKAIDDLSARMWGPADKFDIFCTLPNEVPAGWGGQSAADNSSQDFNPQHYDYSLSFNQASSALAFATSSSWDYSGLPSFYDLSQSLLDDTENAPLLRFAIRVRRAISETKTSEGRSAIKPPSSQTAPLRFNNYEAKPAGGNEMVAVSGSEVYFERPVARSDGNEELSSLFNPYWQVRLYRSDADVQKAQAMQGAVLP